MPLSERSEVASDALKVDTRPAMNRDERIGASTDHAVEESRRVGRGDVALANRRTVTHAGIGGATRATGEVALRLEPNTKQPVVRRHVERRAVVAERTVRSGLPRDDRAE